MADAQTGRLCTQIIHSQFGPLTAVSPDPLLCAQLTSFLQNVASVLLTRGRLTLPQVVRFTSMKPRTVRACIIVLVQHNVLWHAQSDDEGGVFELNVEECLLRLRFGRFVWQAAQLFGDPVRCASHVAKCCIHVSIGRRNCSAHPRPWQTSPSRYHLPPLTRRQRFIVFLSYFSSQ